MQKLFTPVLFHLYRIFLINLTSLWLLLVQNVLVFQLNLKRIAYLANIGSRSVGFQLTDKSA